MQLVIGLVGRPHGLRGEVPWRSGRTTRIMVVAGIAETALPERGPLTVVAVRWHWAGCW
jgi:hypothetical protein